MPDLVNFLASEVSFTQLYTMHVFFHSIHNNKLIINLVYTIGFGEGVILVYLSGSALKCLISCNRLLCVIFIIKSKTAEACGRNDQIYTHYTVKNRVLQWLFIFDTPRGITNEVEIHMIFDIHCKISV